MEIKVTIAGVSRTFNTKDVGLVPDSNGVYLVGSMDKRKVRNLITHCERHITNTESKKAKYLSSNDGVASPEILDYLKSRIDFELRRIEKYNDLLNLVNNTHDLKIVTEGETLENRVSLGYSDIVKSCILPEKDPNVKEQFAISIHSLKTNKLVQDALKSKGLLDNLIAGVVEQGFSEEDFKVFTTCLISYMYAEDTQKGLLPVLNYANNQDKPILDVKKYAKDFERLNDYIKNDVLPRHLVKTRKNKVKELCINLSTVTRLVYSAVLTAYFELLDANYMFRVGDFYTYNLDDSKNKLYTDDRNKVNIHVELEEVEDSYLLTVSRKN